MGKVLKTIAVIGAIAVAFVPGVGPALSGLLVSIGGGTFAALGVASAVVGAVGALGTVAALGIAAKTLGLGPKQPKISSSAVERLQASLIPTTGRKMLFGQTALATDLRYQAYTGANQEYYHQIIAVASHRIAAVDELWLDDKKAWSSIGGVTADFAGYLTVTVVLEGSAANMINIDGIWNAANNRRLTGCAYVHLRFKLTGNSKKAESPFAASITNRMTIIGKGALVYDPRRDSTVGGTGTMRADDQSTWAYTVSGQDIGRNAALVELWNLLGWRINGKLAVGRGVLPSRIDMASFIASANLCDEAITLATGGTEPRYRFDGIFSEEDDGASVRVAIETAMNAALRDAGGRLSLTVLHNDLAAPVLTLSEHDVIGPHVWDQTGPLSEDRNIVRGRYTNASALYQLADYPAVTTPNIDGIDRILSLDLPGVQSTGQAQRLAKQQLQRLKYQGTFSAPFNARGWAAQQGKIVAFDFSPLGWSGKLFRVIEQSISVDGSCALVLQEEHESIYAWDKEEQAAVTPPVPTSYNYLNNPMLAQPISFRGEYSDAVDYLVGDIVTNAGAVYIFLTDWPAGSGTPVLDTNWQVFVPAGAPGGSAIVPALSAPSQVVAATAGGAVPSFTGIGGTMRLRNGASEVTSGVTYSLVSAVGMTAAINASTGAYTVSALAQDTAIAIFRGTYGGEMYDAVYTLAKAKGGAAGADGDPGKDGADGPNIYDPFDYATMGDFLAAWTPSNAAGEASVVTTGDIGGTAIKLGNNAGNDNYTVISKASLPYAPEDLYAIDWDVEIGASGASAVLFLGISALDAAGANLPSDRGTYNYIAAYNMSQATPKRFTATGYFRGRAAPGAGVGYLGTDITSPAILPNGTVSVKALAIANYNAQPGQLTLHEVRLRKVEDATVIATGPWTSTRSYFRNEGVTLLGRSFGSKVDGNLAHQPPTTATSDAWWYLIADKGTDGMDGTDGTDGVSPIQVDVLPSSVSIRGDAGGAAYPTLLPAVAQIVVRQGTTILTPTSVTIPSGGKVACDGTVSATTVTITSVSDADGSLSFDVVADGQTVRGRFDYAVVADGSPGATSASFTRSSPQVTSSSYVDYGAAMAINADGAGNLKLTFTGSAKAPDGGDLILQSKWQIQPAGGSRTDVAGSEKTSTQSQWVTDPDRQTSAQFGTSVYNLTGLTPGGAYLFYFMVRKTLPTWANSATCDFRALVERPS